MSENHHTYNLADGVDCHSNYNEECEELYVNEDVDIKLSNVKEDEKQPNIVKEDASVNEIVMDYTNVFTNMDYFPTREAMQEWVRRVAKQNNMVIVVKRSDNGNGKKKPQVFLACERGGEYREFKGKKGNKKPSQKMRNMDDVVEKENNKPTEKDTGTKKCGCPFLLKSTQVFEGAWMLEVKSGIHNHPVARFMDGHSYVGRLTTEEEKFVIDMSKTNAPAKDVLFMLKRKNTDNYSTIRNIYNVRKKHKVIEYGGRSQLQQLMKLLGDNGYFHSHRSCKETNNLRELFFAHPTSIKLFRAFPSVLIMDCTYKTNRYRLPYLEMVGFTSTGMTFSVASAFLHAEKEDNYTWALSVLREILDDACLPKIILTDREKALMNAVASKFPQATHFLCTWHIDRNVLAKCKEKFKTKESWDIFYNKWRNVMKASTEEEFTNEIHFLHQDYAEIPVEKEAYEYVMDQWVTPYKEKFVATWTDQVMHFENTTTNRVESHHAALKRSLGNSMGNFETCWARTHILFEVSHNAIKASFEKSLNVAQHKFRPVVYKDLRGIVSSTALEKLYNEIQKIECGESDPLTCNHYLRKVCGLPCTHELDEYLRLRKPIPIDVIDPFWRKLDMEPVLRDDACDDDHDVEEDMDSHFEHAIKVVIGRYKNENRAQRRLLLRQVIELGNPVTTSLVEPEPKIHTRGRPKAKASKKRDETSTKRDPSLFEYKESMIASCSVNSIVHEVPDAISSPMFQKKHHFAKRPVIRKRAQSDSLGNFVQQLPVRYQPHILECKDVKGDGHCGFRVVAGLMGFGEDNWAKVRQDLMNELSHHIHLYEGAFNEAAQVPIILNALNCFMESAPFKHWFQLPYMGYLVASAYNVAFITLSKDISLTYLPLRTASLDRPKSICMGMVNNIHFVQVLLAVDCLMPPVASSWEHNHLPVANGWNEVYTSGRIQ